MRFHLTYPRDGGPVVCDCKIGYNHDVEDVYKPLTVVQDTVHRIVADLVTRFVQRHRDYLFDREALENAITTGAVTKAQVVSWFAEELDNYF